MITIKLTFLKQNILYAWHPTFLDFLHRRYLTGECALLAVQIFNRRPDSHFVFVVVLCFCFCFCFSRSAYTNSAAWCFLDKTLAKMFNAPVFTRGVNIIPFSSNVVRIFSSRFIFLIIGYDRSNPSILPPCFWDLDFIPLLVQGSIPRSAGLNLS